MDVAAIIPPWKNQDFTKDVRKNMPTQKVEPMGDYRTNERAKVRKFDSLLGVEPKVKKQEFVFADNSSVKELSDLEKWELERVRALEISKETSVTAFKRDEGAWVDEDGYAAVKEVPKYREGYNNTEFIKPKQAEHLHNGLQLVKERENGMHFPAEAPITFAKDAIHRNMAKRADLAALVGSYFMRGIQSGVEGITSGGLEKDGQRTKGEIELLLQSLEQIAEKSSSDYQELSTIEIAKRHETLSKALGNAFVSIGMTLPAGKRDDPLRNDVVALKLGNSIMTTEAIGVRSSSFPQVDGTLREEVAIALGRAMLHLRQAANIEASRSSTNPIVDKDMKTLKVSLGNLTLQLIENSAGRNGKMITKDPVRREILANALGSTVIQMETASTHRNLTADRQLKPEILNVSKNQQRIQTNEISNIALQGPKQTTLKRNVIKNNRPLLPSRDAAPTALQRQGPLHDRRVK